MLRRHALGLAAAGPILVGKTLAKLGLKTPPEAWRKLLGVGLRGEPSKFGLSAFGLRVPADDLPARLHAFLRTEPEAAYALTHTSNLSRRTRCDSIDLVVQQFDEDGALEDLEAHLDPACPCALSADARRRVHRRIVAAHRATHSWPESRRPQGVGDFGCQELMPAEIPYALRLLNAACLQVEVVEPLTRFVAPAFFLRRGLGHNAYTFVARTDPAADTTDLWGTAHHVAADGVPFQELLTRLEHAWGTELTTFPEAGTIYPPRPASIVGEREAYHSLSFHDFAPLLRVRRAVNAELGLDVPAAALLLWVLAKQPEFAATKFASTVDVPATATRERCVDLVPRRPADFHGDLAAFARSFLDGVAASRERRSPVQAAGADLAHLPPRLFRALLEAIPDRLADTFGEVGLSVIRDAKVFTAPLSDLAYPGGFLAVGGMGLPAARGTVGVLSVKGTREQAERYPAVVARAVAACAG